MFVRAFELTMIAAHVNRKKIRGIYTDLPNGSG